MLVFHGLVNNSFNIESMAGIVLAVLVSIIPNSPQGEYKYFFPRDIFVGYGNVGIFELSTQCDVDVCGVIFQPMDSQKDLAISYSQKIWFIDLFVYLHTGQLGFILTPIFVEVCPAWDSVMVTFPDEVLDFVRVI